MAWADMRSGEGGRGTRRCIERSTRRVGLGWGVRVAGAQRAGSAGDSEGPAARRANDRRGSARSTGHDAPAPSDQAAAHVRSSPAAGADRSAWLYDAHLCVLRAGLINSDGVDGHAVFRVSGTYSIAWGTWHVYRVVDRPSIALWVYGNGFFKTQGKRKTFIFIN
jgi:hypothetical protein